MALEGQVAIITGASAGIGAAVAENLDEAGMSLVITSRREKNLRELSSRLKNAAHIVAGDIVDKEMPQRLIDEAVSKFGRCDVVVNNAGIMMQAASIEEIDLDMVGEMVRTNVKAAYRLAYTALRHFKSQNSGYLVNTSSVLGTKIRPTTGPYAGTKWAIDALTEALRMELAGTGVGISAIEPGLVMTELHDDWEVHPKDSLGIDRPLQPADIARAVRFVLEQPDHVRIPKIMVLPADHAI